MLTFLITNFKYYAPFLLLVAFVIYLIFIARKSAKNFWKDYSRPELFENENNDVFNEKVSRCQHTESSSASDYLGGQGENYNS